MRGGALRGVVAAVRGLHVAGAGAALAVQHGLRDGAPLHSRRGTAIEFCTQLRRRLSPSVLAWRGAA